MVKVVYIGILRNGTGEPIELTTERDLSTWGMFTRGAVSEFCTFFAQKVAKSTKPGQRQQVDAGEEYSFLVHSYGRSEGICGIVITDKTYPEVVPQSLLSKICDEFISKHPRPSYANLTAEQAKERPLAFPELKTYIKTYQNPAEVDSMTKIQRELDDTTQVLKKTMESVLERGEKIEDLVAKSDGLSSQSKMFYTQAKKQNSCCVVM